MRSQSIPLCEQALFLEGLACFRDASYDKSSDAFVYFLDKYPQSERVADVLYLLGGSLSALRKYPEAIAVYERLIKESADWKGKAIYRIGMAQLETGEFRQALETFQGLQEGLTGEFADKVRHRIGDALFNMGLYKKALFSYEKAAGSFFSTARFQLGSCHYRDGDFGRAADEFGRLVAGEPESGLASEAQCWQAAALLKSGNFLSSRKEYQRLLSVYPGSNFIPNAFFGTANTYYEENNYKNAACEYEKFLKSFPDNSLSPDALFLAGLCYKELDLKERAREKFQLYLVAYPEGAHAGVAGLHLGRYLHEDGRHKEAGARFLEILEKKPTDKLASHAHYWLGRSYESDGNLEQAKEEYSKSPTGSLRRDALLRTGNILRTEGKFFRAIKVYEEIISDFKGEIIAYYWLGRSLQALKKWDEAISVFRNVEDRGDEQLRADVQFRIALSHEQMGRLTEAGLGYLKVVYLYPDLSELVLEAESKVADCFERQGRFEEAKNFYKKIIRADPSGAKGELARERIKALKQKNNG